MSILEFNIDELDQATLKQPEGFTIAVQARKTYDFSHPPKRPVEGNSYQPTFRHTDTRPISPRKNFYPTKVDHSVVGDPEAMSLFGDQVKESATPLRVPGSPKKTYFSSQFQQESLIQSSGSVQYNPPPSNFLTLLSNNPLYQKINIALQTFEGGKYNEALILLENLYDESFEEMINIKADSLRYKEYLVVCIESKSYMGIVYRCKGNNKKAIEMLEDTLKKFSIAEPVLLGNLYMEIGRNYEQLCQFNRALDFFVKALNLYERNQWKGDMAHALTFIAQIYGYYGLMEEAKKIAYQALELLRSASMRDQVRISQVHFVLGQMYCQNREYEFATQELELTYDMRKEILGQDHLSIAEPLNMLGVLYMQKNEPKLAEKFFIKAYMVFGDDSQVAKAQILNNLGLVYSTLGNRVNAEKAFEKALFFYSQNFDEKHPLVIRAHKNRALLSDIE